MTQEAFLIGVEKMIAPGETELVGTPCEVTSKIIGEKLDPYFASIWLPLEQGTMNVVAVRIGKFKLTKLAGKRGFSDNGAWVILRLEDPVRVPAGDDVLLEVRNAAEPKDVDRLANDPRVFRAMLGFALKVGQAAPGPKGVVLIG